jgi:hypothetical protein
VAASLAHVQRYAGDCARRCWAARRRN